MMFAAALVLTALVCLFFAAVPAYLFRRGLERRDFVPGIAVFAAVWLWGICFFSKPGLTVNFDGFRFIIFCAAAGWLSVCGCGFRLLPLVRGKLYRPAVLAVLLLTALGGEVFVCNVNYFSTHGYQPFQLFDYLVPDEGRIQTEDGVMLTGDNPFLYFEGINQPVYNLQLDQVTYINTDGDYANPDPCLQFNVSASDEANVSEITGGRWWYAAEAPRTRWLTLDFSGSLSSLTLECYNFEQNEWASFLWTIRGITANTPRPLDFSIARFAALFAVLCIGWALRPSGMLWKTRYFDAPKRFRPCVAGLILCFSILACLAPFAVPSFSGIATEQYNAAQWDGTSPVTFTMHVENGTGYQQLGSLAHSLLNGRLDLIPDPPAELAEMDNPYDPRARDAAGAKPVWDIAYYNERYYVYFGIIPCLLFQLPFEVITGIQDLPACFPMILMSIAAIFAAFGLVKQAAKRWFPKISAAAYLIASAAVVGCSQLYYLLLRPVVYEYVILCGASFVMLGLWQWMTAANTPVEKRKTMIAHMMLGSLFMAFVAGCRPQMEIFAFLALPIFWKRYITERRLFTRKGAVEFVLFALPFVIVAAGLMWYNYARFGSPFDFGANYNLTSNDMTKRGFSAARIGPALFIYLLAPSPLSATFPYIGATIITTNALGNMIYEACYGGILTMTPFLWIFAGLPLLRRRLAWQKLWGVVGWCLFSGLALAILDAEMAGILYRYLMDFTLPLLFAAALCWLAAGQALAEHSDEALMPKVQRIYRIAMPLSAAAGMVFQFLLFFSAAPYIYRNSLGLFNTVSRLVQFWL